MRVTEKGQVTIPKAVREKLGIEPGTEVDFVDDGAGGFELVRVDGGTAKQAEVTRLLRWIDAVQGTGDLAMSTDEVMLATRGRRLGNAD